MPLVQRKQSFLQSLFTKSTKPKIDIRDPHQNNNRNNCNNTKKQKNDIDHSLFGQGDQITIFAPKIDPPDRTRNGNSSKGGNLGSNLLYRETSSSESQRIVGQTTPRERDRDRNGKKQAVARNKSMIRTGSSGSNNTSADSETKNSNSNSHTRDNRYQKIQKSQTFRSKFKKYNKPSRTKSDLSHVTRPNQRRGVSTSNIHHACQNEISNNLKKSKNRSISNFENKIIQSNYQSYTDLKSNLYISTNKLNNGYSRCDLAQVEQNFDFGDGDGDGDAGRYIGRNYCDVEDILDHELDSSNKDNSTNFNDSCNFTHNSYNLYGGHTGNYRPAIMKYDSSGHLAQKEKENTSREKDRESKEYFDNKLDLLEHCRKCH